MIGFNFNPVVKKSKLTTVKVKKESTVISRGVIGVIHIDLEGKYSINISNTNYNLTKESFNCTEHNIVYSKYLINGTTMRQVRVTEPLIKDNYIYLPFRVGSICKGNLVQFKDRMEFDLKSIINQNNK